MIAAPSARAALLLWAGLLALLAFGPRPVDLASAPAAIVCPTNPSQNRMIENMAACDLPPGCYCEVRPSLIPTYYYAGLIPIVFIGAVWFTDRRMARGTSAAAAVVVMLLMFASLVFVILATGLPIPLPQFTDRMAFIWPQWMLFGPSLYGPTPGQTVFTGRIGDVVTLVTWGTVAIVVGLATRPLESLRAVVFSAMLSIVLLVMLIPTILALFGLHVRLELP